MKFFLKNNLKAFTFAEALIATTIIVVVFSWVFIFITNNYNYIKDSSNELSIFKISKFQDEINLLENEGYFKKAYKENSYIIFEKEEDKHFLIFFDWFRLWLVYWNFSDISSNNINFRNLFTKNFINVLPWTLKIKEISSSNYKTSNYENKIHKIEFEIENNNYNNNEKYTLFI